MPLIIDPGLYLSTKKDVFWVSPKRTLPTSFKLFTGKCSYSYPNISLDFKHLMVCDFLNHVEELEKLMSLYLNSV